MSFYIIFGTVALSCLVVKGLFLCFIPAKRLPSFFEKTLRYIPGSALSALIAPAIIYTKTGGDFTVSFSRTLAGGLAFIIAMGSQNIFITIFSGLGMLWAFSWIIQS